MGKPDKSDKKRPSQVSAQGSAHNSDQSSAISIGELAERAGVSRRVVRFYVQRELIPAPQGRGRGSYYTESHLQQILCVQELQAAGHSLDAIAKQMSEAGASASRSTKQNSATTAFEEEVSSNVETPPDARQNAPGHIQRRAKARLKEREDEVTAVQLMQRVVMMPGIELSVDVEKHPLTEDEIKQIKAVVAKVVAKRK